MHARVEAFLPPQALRHLPPTTHIPSQPAHGSGQASTPPQAGEGLGPPLPNPTLRPAHPLSCQAGLQRYLSQGALSSLIRKVVTGTLAAKGGGGLRAVTRLRKTKCLPPPRPLGPICARGCGRGRDRDNGPSTESPSGTHPWVSGPRAETSQSFLVKLAACLLAGLDSLSDA